MFPQVDRGLQRDCWFRSQRVSFPPCHSATAALAAPWARVGCTPSDTWPSTSYLRRPGPVQHRLSLAVRRARRRRWDRRAFAGARTGSHSKGGPSYRSTSQSRIKSELPFLAMYDVVAAQPAKSPSRTETTSSDGPAASRSTEARVAPNEGGRRTEPVKRARPLDIGWVAVGTGDDIGAVDPAMRPAENGPVVGGVVATVAGSGCDTPWSIQATSPVLDN